MSMLSGRPLVREGFDVARQCYVYTEVGTGKVVYYRLPNGRIVLPKEELIGTHNEGKKVFIISKGEK